MPVLSPASLLNTLVARNTTAANVATSNALQVVCAWPVSGQYGIASRMLYYALIMTCIFYRKVMWLNNACMAAVWLFPAVTALHAIIIASVHVNGAVDMDIYGSFQICLTGVLSAPVTFRLSRIFYNRSPGRNTILLWTALVLGGLISLLVEFLRAQSFPCVQNESEPPISSDPTKFPYNTTCNLTCSVQDGPFSPLREGSGNNIYVIPAPNKLTFGTATLFAAAGCVQVILSLMSMWRSTLELNWQERFGGKEEEVEGARVDESTGELDKYTKIFLRAISLPLFIAALLAVIVIGERNLFSSQLRYQTEPIASIGQWAPCTGAALSVLWAYCADGGSDQDDKRTDEPIDQSNEPSINLSDNGEPSASSSVDDNLRYRRQVALSLQRAVAFSNVPGEQPSPGSDNEDSISIILRRPLQAPSPLRPLATATIGTMLTRRLSPPG
ncbi:hypothetical protein VE04_01369 [Pseudogymnoascus sp. 24MN13]|nr:hypothetical protein VE04_01369 [Pseudogymnoascus sp. 24MN13]